MNRSQTIFLILRYLFLVVLAFNLQFIYKIFTFLTVYPIFYLLFVIDNSTFLIGNIISYKGISAAIIPACVAGAAYFLLLILNFTTPMNKKTRAKSLAFLLLSFLVLNIARIIFFINLAVFSTTYFDAAHLFFWYAGSTILVVILWFANVRLFKIKSIPFFTDAKNIFRDARQKTQREFFAH